MFWRELNLSALEWVGIMSWLEAAGARWCRGGWRGKTGNERPRWAEDESKTENGARVVALPRRPASRMQKSEDELTSKYCRMGRVEGGSRREGELRLRSVAGKSSRLACFGPVHPNPALIRYLA